MVTTVFPRISTGGLNKRRVNENGICMIKLILIDNKGDIAVIYATSVCLLSLRNIRIHLILLPGNLKKNSE